MGIFRDARLHLQRSKQQLTKFPQWPPQVNTNIFIEMSIFVNQFKLNLHFQASIFKFRVFTFKVYLFTFSTISFHLAEKLDQKSPKFRSTWSPRVLNFWPCVFPGKKGKKSKKGQTVSLNDFLANDGGNAADAATTVVVSKPSW